MERLTLGLFSAGLLASIVLDISILYALVFGLLLFLLYGRHRGFAWNELARTAWSGVLTVRNILITFLFIGILTAFWRAAGTIPVILCYASGLIRPSLFLLMTFLLNCGVSVLTGTSFGTGATMGVICAAMAAAMGVDMRLVGGAILSGVYFGDRCSPVSTSALLVADLTGTNIFRNIRRMLRSAFLPFLFSCAVYAWLGRSAAHSAGQLDLPALFGREYVLHWSALLPAAVILLLSILRVRVRTTMLASILSAAALCVGLQHIAPMDLPRIALMGFTASDAAIAALVSGGGVASMLKVAGIVCLSASYSGLFQKTGLLESAKRAIHRLSDSTTPFAAMLVTSVLSGMIACNQTLTVMLTHQLCAFPSAGGYDCACDLEDTAIVIAPLVPWSIAGGVPLAAAGAPTGSILFACYLYLLPLWRLAGSLREKHRGRRSRQSA